MVIKWQYNGIAPWHEIIDWCKANLDNTWHCKWETIYFQDGRDYILFLMKWS